ncbi:hypothetical protein [Actinoplanes sp. G11-F43]|uniref:hypothetical protein n=1 Tax=Actinoplanes sp. G11-F43 TaxID=3424130 RepID=UPI003D333F64
MNDFLQAMTTEPVTYSRCPTCRLVTPAAWTSTAGLHPVACCACCATVHPLGPEQRALSHPDSTAMHLGCMRFGDGTARGLRVPCPAAAHVVRCATVGEGLLVDLGCGQLFARSPAQQLRSRPWLSHRRPLTAATDPYGDDDPRSLPAQRSAPG